MRRLGALLWLAVLGLSLHNWWQIKTLRQELEAQRAAVRVSERAAGGGSALQRAMERSRQARKLLEHGQYRKAATELDGAIGEFRSAARATDEATAERLRRVEETLTRVRDQAQGLLRRATPASGEKRDRG